MSNVFESLPNVLNLKRRSEKSRKGMPAFELLCWEATRLGSPYSDPPESYDAGKLSGTPVPISIEGCYTIRAHFVSLTVPLHCLWAHLRAMMLWSYQLARFLSLFRDTTRLAPPKPRRLPGPTVSMSPLRAMMVWSCRLARVLSLHIKIVRQSSQSISALYKYHYFQQTKQVKTASYPATDYLYYCMP